ncbi:hypothetical protein HH212_18735 [Massilia forsythiae]|uniref:Uncharacterized protein n=1 Tax=Massilia forsythiae TaxID=2728020 RepID=A0A7Z2ZV80_9BURK|nr:hypothetical protein [Massilia forsythiae]QJE01812.1 hypothetical protein HH212_18735 [Massilia forsythiae]
MNSACFSGDFPSAAPPPRGIELPGADPAQAGRVRDLLDALALGPYVAESASGAGHAFALAAGVARDLVPGGDTMHLCRDLGLDSAAGSAGLEREIVLAMLAAPRPLRFASACEVLAALAIRRNTVLAARRTRLAFGTAAVERPPSHWTYDPGRGFTVLPGRPLVEALTLATQPGAGDGRLYGFSCYRASEYVLLLGIAQELERVNPPLLARLQRQWETRAIQSGAFHDTFLDEYGSIDAPLPLRYYVPGDRVWFRNPDARSSDASGYEGSWVIYLGNGEFANFWKQDQPYTFESKCVEMYHWRDAVYLDAAGDARIDEAVVEARVRETMADPQRRTAVLARMARLRDGRGVYADGGCLDHSRESARSVCPGSARIALPSARGAPHALQ